RQWLTDALKENDPSNVLLFLVGSKKDLSTPAQYSLMEKDALKVAQEIKAEYWAVSSLTGENVREFFFRVAALTFEANVLAELEKSGARHIADVVRINSDDKNLFPFPGYRATCNCSRTQPLDICTDFFQTKELSIDVSAPQKVTGTMLVICCPQAPCQRLDDPLFLWGSPGCLVRGSVLAAFAQPAGPFMYKNA
ncbi:RAB34, member of RAS oncogene family, isoform CRA_a, partial [Mus musculus]